MSTRRREVVPHLRRNIKSPGLPSHGGRRVFFPNLHIKKCMATKRRRFSSYEREIIGHRQGWKCIACADMLQPAYHIDHIIPLAAGGRNALDNLQAMCPGCHTHKTYDENKERAAKQRELSTGISRFFDKFLMKM